METAIASTGHGGKRKGGVGHPKDQYVPRDVRERLVAAKAEREEHQARLAQLEVAERERTLVDAGEALRSSRRAGMVIRDAMLSVPGKIAADLVGLDEREIERRMTLAIRDELTRLAQTVATDAA